jgi:hypothetical protein
MDLVIGATISMEDLIENLVMYTNTDELVSFVEDLDMSEANWDFTEKMYKYFKSQHKIFKAEC